MLIFDGLQFVVQVPIEVLFDVPTLFFVTQKRRIGLLEKKVEGSICELHQNHFSGELDGKRKVGPDVQGVNVLVHQQLEVEGLDWSYFLDLLILFENCDTTNTWFCLETFHTFPSNLRLETKPTYLKKRFQFH